MMRFYLKQYCKNLASLQNAHPREGGLKAGGKKASLSA
jgi:hypothetical protein